MRGRVPLSLGLAPLGLLALLAVACAGEVDSTKDADDSTITAGQEASFTITVVAEPTNDTECLLSSQELKSTIAGFGSIVLCSADGTITDPLPPGIDWDFQILQNDASPPGTCNLVPGPGLDQETLECTFENLEMPVGTVGTAGVFSVRVFGQTDPNDCPRTLTNVATVASGEIFGSGPTETEMPSDTIEVVCSLGTVIEPPDIDPIGPIDPDIDISATPSIVFPTPDPDDPDEGPSVGTGDSGLSDGDGGFSLGWIAILGGLTLGSVAAAFGAIRFARR